MRNGTWAYITAGGKYGFCNLYALQPLNSSTTQTPSTDLSGYRQVNMTAVVATATTVYAQANTSSQALATLQAGAQVRVTAYNTQWAYISRAEGNGFVPLSSVLPATTPSCAPATASPSAPPTSMRRPRPRPPWSAAFRAATCSPCSPTPPAGPMCAWTNGTQGYLSLSAIIPYDGSVTATPAPTPSIPTGEGTSATVVVDRLDVYGTPSAQGEYLGYIAYGTQVTVLDQNGTWALITPDGSKYGYCLLSGLKANSQFTDGTAATVTVDFLTIYRSASTSSAVLGSIKRGDQVTVVDHNGTWAYVLSPSGNYGFCQLSGLTPTSQVQPDPDDDTVKYVATVVYPKAPFFQSASQDSAYVTVSAGTDVNVYKYNPSTYTYIYSANQRGYMLLDHLNKNSYATLTENASGASVLVLQQELEKRGSLTARPRAITVR